MKQAIHPTTTETGLKLKFSVSVQQNKIVGCTLNMYDANIMPLKNDEIAGVLGHDRIQKFISFSCHCI